MVVHNADGSIAEMCGNGLRCVAKHLLDREPARDALEVETGAGVLPAGARRVGGEVVEVEIELGPARLDAPHCPVGRAAVRSSARRFRAWTGPARRSAWAIPTSSSLARPRRWCASTDRGSSTCRGSPTARTSRR